MLCILLWNYCCGYQLSIYILADIQQSVVPGERQLSMVQYFL